MKKSGIFLLFIFYLLFSPGIGISQENFASNITKSVSDNEKLLITYDILVNDGSRSFSVILILTHNGKKINASAVYGDIGSNIEPGREKAMVWYFKSDFDGNINDVDVDVYAYKENEPQAIFKIVSLSNNGYAPCTVVFSNSSSYANEYQWDFGDQASGVKNLSFEKDPTHIFENGGIYSIALIARNTQLKLENTYYQSIEIKAHEKTLADFEIEGNNQLAPARIKFKSTSLNADTYSWDFGDPGSKKKNKSDKKEAEHKYENAGTYTVELEVRNNFSKITDQITREVVVEEKKLPEAMFTYSLSSETAPTTVVFKNTSMFANSYQWDFGDPASGNKNTSGDVDPAHVYASPGKYKVELSAYSKGSKKPVKKSEIIEIKELPKPPQAEFTIQNNNVLGPATIVFNNNSVNATSFAWDFGDPQSGSNNTSDKQNPTHTYTNAGKYKVALTASNVNFQEKSSVTDYVIIIEPAKPPLAKFRIANNNVQSPADVNFINESENADNFSWDFGDTGTPGNSSTVLNPSHNYQKAGRYKVVLTATNNRTGEKSIFSDYVIISEAARAVPNPVANFTIENNNKPSPAIVSFTNKSVNAHSYTWDFGDEGSEENTSVIKNPTHVYSTAGRYMVNLVAKNDNTGETSSYTDFVVVSQPVKPTIRPVANFTLTGSENVAPVSIVFSNTSTNGDSFEWNFGDSGSADNTSVERNPTHFYQKEGRYKVELKVSNSASGLTSTFSDFITISAPTLQPIARFEIENNNSLAPVLVQFKNTSENAESYAWNFGDPSSGEKNSSIEQNPNHEYKQAGDYTVTLAVLNKNSGQEDEIVQTVTVVKPAEPPVANFDITFNGEFVPIDIKFKNLSKNADEYSWNFGDFDSETNESDQEAPSHNYKFPGSYKITLVAKNSQTGEANTFTKEIKLKSSFNTFVKKAADLGDMEQAVAIVPSSDNEYLALVNSKNNSRVIKMNNRGETNGSTDLGALYFNILNTAENNRFMLIGLEGSRNLAVQLLNKNLELQNKVMLPDSKKYKTDFASPKLAMSKTNEVGIVANVIDDKYPISILFEKTDQEGRTIPLIDRTFKYIGTKVATDFIPTTDGGFALTGYWKEKEKDPALILFGKIDRKGRGEMHLISSQYNIIGYDIKETFSEGFAILRARENTENNQLYELSFTIIDDEGGPTDCANDLPCTIKEEDLLRYEPAMIKTGEGYVIASHAFNGVDYDVRMFWLDKSGNSLLNYSDVKLPGDQFVMDFIQSPDGGYVIVGAEKVAGKNNALIIQTDPFGKMNQ